MGTNMDVSSWFLEKTITNDYARKILDGFTVQSGAMATEKLP